MPQSSEIRDWTIYKITNPNGRVYIGVTSNYKKRISEYRSSGCRKQPIIYNSIKKYGLDSHKFEIIDSFTSGVAYASGKEIFWIRSYMSNRCKWPEVNGMNSNDGGGSNIGFKMSESSKIKISNANKGRKVSPEGRLRMAEAKKGYIPPPRSKEGNEKIRIAKLGVKRSEETKRKMSEWRTGKKFPNYNYHTEKRIAMYNRLNKPILQLDLNGSFLNDFTSLKEAVKVTGLSKNTISNCAKGRIIYPTKFIFKYK